MTYREWAERYPEAAASLQLVITTPGTVSGRGDESAVQQSIRLKVARAGAFSWRNNVGATPARCPDCGAKRQPIRYGLANDSAAVNGRLKSSDLILAVPRVIMPADVGLTLAQFGSIECKPLGWRFTGRGREGPQAAWVTLINKIGGFARFSTGEIEI